MIKIGILGDIGSGKTFIANQFGYPVFNADIEVSKIYQNNKSCFKILKKNFPNHIFSFPIKNIKHPYIKIKGGHAIIITQAQWFNIELPKIIQNN